MDLTTEILQDFINAPEISNAENISSYDEWLVGSFGSKFAETFPMQYAVKYHTTTASNMTTDWLGPRLYRPQLEEVLRGALSSNTSDVHYISRFRYPSIGGFTSFLNQFLHQADLRLLHEVVRIDPKRRIIQFANGVLEGYDHVISSIPLPDLVEMVDQVPPDVREAAGRLACTTCVLVNIGIDREDISSAHWTYFYDQDFFFTRLNFPHMLSPNNTPSGTGSIQAEVYYSDKYRPLDRKPQDCIDPVIQDKSPLAAGCDTEPKTPHLVVVVDLVAFGRGGDFTDGLLG